jgi:DNA-binding CsgD family transcriptional regulator
MKIYTGNDYLREGLTQVMTGIPDYFRETDITILDMTAPQYVPDDIAVNPGQRVYVVSGAITPAVRGLYARKLRRGFFISLQMPVSGIAAVLRQALSGEPPPGPRDTDELLTRIEINAVFFLSLGLSTWRCARLLKMSTAVLSGHKRSAMRKLGLSSDMELWRFMTAVTGEVAGRVSPVSDRCL